MDFKMIDGLESSLEKQNRLFDQVTALTVEIHQLTDELGIFNITTQKIRQFLHCDRVIIYQFLPQGDGVILAESVIKPWKSLVGQLVYDPCFQEKWSEPYRLGKISVIEDIDRKPTESCYLKLLEKFQAKANIIVPILSGKKSEIKLWGLLVAHQCQTPRFWDDLEIKLCQNIAVQVGIALRNLQGQKIQEEALIQQEQKANCWKENLLISMTDSSLLGFYVVDNRTDQILHFNHRFCEIWGLEHLETAMQLGQLKNNDIIPACMPLIADLPAFVESCKPLQSEENRAIIEDEIFFTDGRTIRRFSSQIRDEQDRYFGRLYLFEDISKRKQIEEALRESEERYRSVITSMAEGIVIHQADGKIIACNQSAEKILGLTEAQIIGRDSKDNLWQTIHEDGSIFEGQNHPAMVTLATGKPQINVIMGIRKPNQELTWISINSQPLFKPNQTQPYGVVTSFIDISEQKQIEAKLKETNQQLSISNAELAKATQAKSEFLANMSHEIRTPMNGVLGMIQLLSLTKLSAEQQELVNTIQDSGNTLLTIINDILDFSKIESGKLQLESYPLLIEDLVKSVCNLFRKQAEDKSIKLFYQLDPFVPQKILGDGSRLRQIILNLVGNSLKFTSQGEVSIRVNLDQDRLIFAIKDTGIGINAERIKQLFKPFTQADASISRQYGGTGLGLSISKSLINLMGGTIWVESFGNLGGNPPENWLKQAGNLNQKQPGSTFYFMIPVTAVLETETQSQTQPEAEKLSISHSPSSLKILLAEDNRVNQKVALFTLKRLGYNADIANNGLEVLAMLQRQQYDLILMDMQMPEMDGLTTTKKIRESKLPQPYIIALTANALEADRQVCLDAGMNDYIRKPLAIAELTEALSLHAFRLSIRNAQETV